MRKIALGLGLAVAACGGDDSSGPIDGGGGCFGSSCATVVGSTECNAFCANLRNACGPDTRCDEDFFCRVRTDECPESTRARLACSAMHAPTCFDGGWSISSCSANNAVCTGGD